MIKNIFIPTNIDSFYIFTERIACIEISKTEILAVVVAAHGRRRKIEQLLKEPIPQDPLKPFQERAQQALEALTKRIASYTTLIALIPSTNVLYKELTVPQISEHKLKMIVPFEVESQLPFPLEQATLDSIITGKDQTKTHALVTVLKQETLQSYLAVYRAAGLLPNRVTVAMIELYGLYRSLNEYAQDSSTTLLLNIEPTVTRIGLIIQRELKMVRIIPKGLLHIQQDASHPVDDEPITVHLNEERSRNALTKLLDEVQLTVEGFLSKMPQQVPLSRILLCGHGADTKGLQEYITNTLGLHCELLSANKVLHLGHVTSKNALPNEFVVPLAAALAGPLTQEFTLDQHAQEQINQTTIHYQIITTAVLFLLLFTALLINNIFTARSLRAEIAASETEAIALLTKQLQLKLPKGKVTTLEQANVQARNEVSVKENIWFSLSSANRFSFLTYLQDLSTRINREQLGLEIRQLTLNEETDIMTIEGQVKNFEALRTFEQELNRSKLFKSVSKPQDLKFNITIVLEKPGEVA